MLDKWPAHSRFASLSLVGLIVVNSLGSGILASFGHISSARFAMVSFVTWTAIVLYWLERDCRRTSLLRVWDRGWFFLLGGWIVFPYYLIKTRGLRTGLVTFLGWPAAWFLVASFTIALAVVLTD